MSGYPQIVYLEDPVDAQAFRRELDRAAIGPRLERLESLLRRNGLLGPHASERVADLRTVVRRRNQLAHGTVHRRPTRIHPIKELPSRIIELEWVLVDRRSRETVRLSMAGLRQDLNDAIGAFAELLAYAERFVEDAPRPRNFDGGAYLGAPTR